MIHESAARNLVTGRSSEELCKVKDSQAEGGTRKPCWERGSGLATAKLLQGLAGVYQADHPTSADQDQVVPDWFKILLPGANCSN